MPKTGKKTAKAPKAQFDWPAFLENAAGRVLDFDDMPEEAREAAAGGYAEAVRLGYAVGTSSTQPEYLDGNQLVFWPVTKPRPATSVADVEDAHTEGPLIRRSLPSRALSIGDIANTLFEGDCLEILPLFPDKSIDMILCDLPYGTTQNGWDSVIPLDRLWTEYERVIKPDGAIVLTSQGLFTARLMLSNESLFKYKIVWEKSKPTNFLNAKKQPLRKHEDVCVFYKRQPVYNPEMRIGTAYDKGVRKNQLSGSYGDFSPVHVASSGLRYPTDVVYFKTAESEGPVWHPTQKPVELGRYLIRTFTKPNDIVLDNAFGSGSFLVAAAAEGRRFVGIEKNENVALFKKGPIDYVEIAGRRIAKAVRMRKMGVA